MVHPNKPRDKWLSTMWNVWLGLAAFLFFLATRAVQHDRNTIYRLFEIESDSLATMAAARHILFSPLAAGFYRLWQSFGYSASSLYPSQILIAAFGGIGIAILSILLFRFCRDRILTVLLAIGFMGSYSYWYHSTDVEYWIPYIVTALAIAVFFLRWLYDEKYASSLAWIILLTYISMLFWSVGIILGIVVAFSFLILPSSYSWARRWKAFIIFGLAEALLLIVSYLWLGLQVHGLSSYRQFVIWMTTYPGRMPIWGSADPRRIFDSAWSLAASVLPFWNGLGLRGLLRGQFDSTKFVPQVALLVTVLFVAIIIVHFVRSKAPLASRRISAFLLLWIVAYSLFITWFDPFEPKWWVIVLIPLWLFLADLSRSWIQHVGRSGYLVISVWVILLVLSNWINAMAPRALDVGDDYRKAMYSIEQMASDDILVMPYTLEWPLYVEYFGKRQLVNLGGIAVYESPDYARQHLIELVCSTDSRAIFLVDYTQLTSAEWQFITENMGISPAFFEGFRTEEAWRWKDEPVWRITGASACTPSP